MQGKKIANILVGKEYRVHQDRQVYNLDVFSPLNGLYVKELKECKGYLCTKVLRDRVRFQFFA